MRKKNKKIHVRRERVGEEEEEGRGEEKRGRERRKERRGEGRRRGREREEENERRREGVEAWRRGRPSQELVGQTRRDVIL